MKNARSNLKANIRAVGLEVEDLRVRDVADIHHPSIYPDELATKARAFLRELRLRVLPVVDEDKRLLGVVSRTDLMTISSSVSPMRVKGIMSKVKFTATPDMDVIQAAKEMLRADEWYVPVVKSTVDSTYLGVLGLENIIKPLHQRNVAGLSTPLSEIMSKKNLFTCSPDDETDGVWQIMKKRAFAACPVVRNGKPIGVVSQQDLLERGAVFPTFESKKGRFKTPSKIFTIMKTPSVTLEPDDTVQDAARLMLEKNIGRVPIVDRKGMLVGIVDREDVLKALIKQQSER